MVVFVNFWILYSLYLIRASWLQVTHFPMGLFVPFMLLALFVNPALRALRRGRGLSRSEILVVAAMGLTGAVVPGFSLMTTLLGTISVPYYLATPENQWSAFFHIHMPDWIAPSNRGGTMRMLFEGLPSEDAPIPLGAWAGPLSWWMALVGAFAFASMCLMVILRRQWVEYERLVYPLAQVAADMAGDAREGGLFPGFMRTRAFKFGFAAATLVMTWNMMSHFAPGFPEIPLGIPSRWTTFFKGFPPLHTTINFYTIGFAYLANLDVLFSIWFFHFPGDVGGIRLREAGRRRDLRRGGRVVAEYRRAVYAGGVGAVDRPETPAPGLQRGAASIRRRCRGDPVLPDGRFRRGVEPDLHHCLVL